MTELTPRQAVDYLYSLDRFTVKPGLERAEKLLAAVDEPHLDVEVVQVGGTNGKGSVARVVESGLRSSGLSVGLYTSPHMLDLGERVQVDGEKTRRRAMRDYVELVQPTIRELEDEGDPPTFFEVTTVMALHEFSRRDVDVAVLEVGLGGRFDTTSVCNPGVSAITNVELEHTETLGDSVAEIAEDVAHVVPSEGVCVTAAEDEALEAVQEMAEERDARVSLVECTDYSLLERDPVSQRFTFDVDGEPLELESPLVGDHQMRNVAVAARVLEELELSSEEIADGVRRASWPGRFEVVDHDPTVVLDAAHNPSGCRALADTYGDLFDRDASVVFGAMGDKDVESMASCVAGFAASVHVAAPAKDRAASAGRLASAFEREDVEVHRHSSVAEAVRTAVADGRPVVATGSMFTVGEARRHWLPGGVTGCYTSVEDASDSLREYSAEPEEAVHCSRRYWNLTPGEADSLREAAEEEGASANVEEDGDYHDAVVSGSLREHRGVRDRVETVQEATPNASSGDVEVVAVVNVTPDSFYDGGRYFDGDDAVERALEAVEQGADVVDVGGESTRPGADPVDVDEEIDRVLPVVETLVDRDVDAEISVDTRNPETARRTLQAGADWINDVTGLEDPEMREVVADAGCRVVLMDSVDVPVRPSGGMEYDDVVVDVVDRLGEKLLLARRAGVNPEDIVLDPGIGFGKGSDGDWQLVRRTDELASLGYPLLVGCSRKSFLTEAVDVSENQRLIPTLTANAVAAMKGASYLRVHDVEETVEMLQTLSRL